MRILVLLLQTTLQTRDETIEGMSKDTDSVKRNENGNNNHLKVVEESTKTLMLAVSKLKISSSKNDLFSTKDKSSNNTRSSSDDDSTSSTANTNGNHEYTTFVKNVKQKIPFPLTILFKLIPTHSSIKVRLAGLEMLCKCILVDTFTFWDDDMDINYPTGDSGSGFHNALQESAFECLMVMMDDYYKEGTTKLEILM